MVDFAISATREEGLTAVEAIRKAALLRFRPIMMTTMAALLGGVPLMLSHGAGSEMRQPLGYTMVHKSYHFAQLIRRLGRRRVGEGAFGFPFGGKRRISLVSTSFWFVR